MTIMQTYNKTKPKGGFVRFMKRLEATASLDNPKGKELKDDYADLLLASERLDFLA